MKMVKKQSQRKNEQPAYNATEKTNRIVPILRWTSLLKRVFEGNIEGKKKVREDEEEDVGGYWTTIRKIEDNRN